MAEDKTVETVEIHTQEATVNGNNVLDNGLQRGLKKRHLQMIALGGVIG
jgi:amino acid transporter